jgi:acetyl-CoA C-acetyltransferase
MSIKDKVAIIGVGTTRFGENFEMSYSDMVVEAAYQAYQDAGLGPDRIEAAWLGTANPGTSALEGDAGTSLAEPLNLYPKPVSRVAAFCSTGMEAIRNAAFAVAAGEYEVVLVVGAEKMRDVPTRGSLVARHILETHPYLCKGRTAPGQFALVATRYMHTFGIGKETLAKVAVKNHHNGSLNPKAHFRNEVTEEQVIKAPMVAEPLGLLDCCPTTDGAAAVILARREVAQELGADYVLIKGIGFAVTAGYFTMQFQANNDFLGFQATREAAAQAYRQAGVSNPRQQIGVAEVHDCFTITEIVNYEDLGFCPRGEGGRFISDGLSALEGELPVNPSGGLKSCGHPVGATGVRMVAEIADQLRGRCGPRQVRDPRLGLAHTLGGPGALSCVIVLGRP